MKERILDILKDKERSIHELQHVLDLNNSEGFTVLLKALNQLEDEGKIVRNDKNEYLLIENSNYIVGVLHINKRGFGFVIIDEESDDILKMLLIWIQSWLNLKSIKQDRVKKVELLKLLKEDKQDLLGC